MSGALEKVTASGDKSSAHAAEKGPPLDAKSAEAIALNDEYLTRLSSLTADYWVHRGYATVRAEFLKLSSALNELCLTAPAFREQPRVPPKLKRDAGHTQLLIDQIVIDCHWLHCRREEVQPRWRELRACFDGATPFDFESVRDRLAAKSWSSEFRANDLLVLTDRQQAQLVQMCAAEMRAKRAEIVTNSSYYTSDGTRQRDRALVTSVRRAVNNWAEVTHQVRGHEEMYEALWVARKLLPPGASSSKIAVLAGLYCGRPPLSPRTVSDKLKQLDKVVDAAQIASRAATLKAQSKAADHKVGLARWTQSKLFGSMSGASLATAAAS